MQGIIRRSFGAGTARQGKLAWNSASMNGITGKRRTCCLAIDDFVNLISAQLWTCDVGDWAGNKDAYITFMTCEKNMSARAVLSSCVLAIPVLCGTLHDQPYGLDAIRGCWTAELAQTVSRGVSRVWEDCYKSKKVKSSSLRQRASSNGIYILRIQGSKTLPSFVTIEKVIINDFDYKSIVDSRIRTGEQRVAM